MIKSREYIGISLEGNELKIARIKAGSKRLELVKLDKLSLVRPVHTRKKEEKPDKELRDEELSDSIFGLDEIDLDEGGEDDALEELDMDSLGIEDQFEKEATQSDLVDETLTASTNEELIVQYLDDLKKNRFYLSLNVPAGNTIFQIIRNANYSKLKRKELETFVLNKLKSIYGQNPIADHYDYRVREDGSLVIASIDEDPPALTIVEKAKKMFDRKYFISDVIPDEVSTVGLYNEHYESGSEGITGLLQFGAEKCRMIFLRDKEVLQVSPVINEGTSSTGFLNTIFSKILFQLDTGEIPGLDRLIIYNNSVGDKAVNFFRKNFPDIDVENFSFNPDKFSYDESQAESISVFTNAIGAASAITRQSRSNYPGLSFLPEHVAEGQKIFKLQWHGVVLLVLIGLSPVILNHFYQQNAQEIEDLSAQVERLDGQISELQPVVDLSESLSGELSQMQGQLELLTDLSRDNIRWSVTIDEFNRAVQRTGSIWINSFRQNQDVIMVDGYSLTRQNIPDLADQFPNVTLLSVRREEVRERDLFFFNMMIRRVVADEGRFTPEGFGDIQQIINP